MTLQQKLLAKKSKKGFTLVELVVVIAILAILAAIAIPMVVNIINSATTSSGDSQAGELSREAGSVYAGIKSGTINNDASKNADGTDVDFAAPKSANAGEKKAAAQDCTILEVKTYSGLNFDLGTEYWYCTHADANANIAVGDIKFSDTGAAPAYDGADFEQLSDGTTLGELYQEN